MPTEARYQPVEEAAEPPTHSNDRDEDYFGEPTQLPTRRNTAHAYESTPGSESILLNQISPEGRRQSDPANSPPMNIHPGPSRTTTDNTLGSGRSSVTKTGRWSLHNFSTPKISSPWDHERPVEQVSTRSDTAREYNYKLQRKRLFTGGVMKFLMTIALCASLAGALIGYEKRWALPKSSKHAFNAVITGISVALSLNLASSFRYYAQVLRWRFLASRYRPLKEFDLLLSCDSQVKVLRLFWEARNRPLLKLKFLTFTQVCCLTWISINLAAQVLVAMLGLTYSLDTSPDHVELSTGTISVVDLSYIRDINNNSLSNSKPGYYQQLSQAQAYGIQAQDFDTEDVSLEGNTAVNTLFFDSSATPNNWEYVFADQNPFDPSVGSVFSGRYIDASAVCNNYDVLDGGSGNQTDITVANTDGSNFTVYIDKTSPGATTYISDTASYCGPRCTRVMAFQAFQAGDGGLFGLDIPSATFFDCNSTLSHVQTTADLADTTIPQDLPDPQAQIAAGAIGWTGFFYANDTREYQLYSTNSPWSLPFTPDSDTMAVTISKFAIGVLAAMDDHGPRLNITGQSASTALILDVKWKYAAPVLGVIPILQLTALLIVISFANKVVIKDDTHLGMARLLRPVVQKLGDHGCVLTGKEISKELEYLRVIYGYREPRNGSDVFHLDILTEEDKGISRRQRRAFEEGIYDGLPAEREAETESMEGLVRGVRRRRGERRYSL